MSSTDVRLRIERARSTLRGWGTSVASRKMRSSPRRRSVTRRTSCGRERRRERGRLGPMLAERQVTRSQRACSGCRKRKSWVGRAPSGRPPSRWTSPSSWPKVRLEGSKKLFNTRKGDGEGLDAAGTGEGNGETRVGTEEILPCHCITSYPRSRVAKLLYFRESIVHQCLTYVHK